MGYNKASATTVWVVENGAGTQLTAGGTWDGGPYSFMFFTDGANNPTRTTALRPTSILGWNDNNGLVPRHLETTNILYADGHVKAKNVDSLLKTNAAGYMPAFTIEDDDN